MDETRSWRRGFVAGFAALALSVGGQVATGADDAVEPAESCPLSRGRLADRVPDRLAPRMDAQGIAQRVAHAVVGAVLHGSI
ncbi:MAG TPA: hypothetical protein VFE90_25180 [Myxococcales bacterium]|jgi:hypothetical protein|nr:hypothetical protein [Myxococcales bacterium]